MRWKKEKKKGGKLHFKNQLNDEGTKGEQLI